MIKKQSKQSELEFVTIDQLVPEDHLVRKINKFVNFSFIDEKVAPLYCHDNGRPAIDPEVLFKMIFLGYIFGIRSERQLVREIETNVAYRWFVNFKLLDKVPHHSTFSKNRKRRFDDSDVYKEIFDDIVFQCIELGLVDGKILYTDSTHMKANANKKKFEKIEVEASTKAYLDELNEDINQDREANGKKPLKKKKKLPKVKR